METVYIDSLFALNALIDYFLLLCSARVCGARLKRGRFALSAALGGAYAAASVLPELGFLSHWVMKLVLAAAMCLAAYGGEERPGRLTVAFLAVSACFGGAVWGASMLAGRSYDGRLYVPVSLRVLVLSFAVCYAAVSLVFRRSGQRAERELVDITISFRGGVLSLRALRDTGNGLCDPLSGRRIIVCEAAALSPLLPEGGAEALSRTDAAEAARLLSALPDCLGRVSLIPYRSVGQGFSLLPTLRPDGALANGRETGALIALCPRRLSEDGGYSAII